MAALEPVAAGGGEGAAGLLAFVLGVFFWALATGWNQTIGAGLRSIAAEIDGVRLPRLIGGGHVLGPVASAFYTADRSVHRALVAVANENFHAGRWFFNASARSWTDLATTLAHVAVSAERAYAHFEEVVLPRWVGHALAHTGAFAVWLLHEAERLERIQHDYTRRALGRTNVRVHRNSIAIADDHARLWPRVGRIEREQTAHKSRLRRIEELLGAGAFAGLLMSALGRLGLRWLRCGNVNKLGRSVCGMNPSLLESLLADALLVVGTLSLVELATEMQSVTEEGVHLIRKWWRVK